MPVQGGKSDVKAALPVRALGPVGARSLAIPEVRTPTAIETSIVNSTYEIEMGCQMIVCYRLDDDLRFIVRRRFLELRSSASRHFHPVFVVKAIVRRLNLYRDF